MQAVGVRELKARLSLYLRRVRAGEVVLVTDRGEVVAEIRPSAPPAGLPPEMQALWDLAQRGAVRLGKTNRGRSIPVSPWHLPAGTARSLLDADREDQR